MNNKLIIGVYMTLLLISCKHGNYGSKQVYTKDNKVETINYPDIENKGFTEVVKQNNEFKLSCANPKNYNHINLTKETLHLEVVEPIDYKINKTEQLNGSWIISFKNEEFYYKVTSIDRNLGITYWENIINGGKNDDYSFYAIDNLKLKSANLKKEDCLSSTKEIDNWVGKYTFSLDIDRMNEKHSLTIVFDIKSLEDIQITSIVDKKNKKIERAQAEENNGELIISSISASKDEYIIKKIADDSYTISGRTIALLNPPNDEYDIDKE